MLQCLQKARPFIPPRMQCDKQLYRLTMKAVVENQPNLYVRQAMIESLVIEDGKVIGVLDQSEHFMETKRLSSPPALF